jgi:hypothetical protein
VPYVAALDLVRGGDDGAGAASLRLGAEGALLLDDDDDAVAQGGRALAFEEGDALDDGGAGVVDAGEEGLVG